MLRLFHFEEVEGEVSDRQGFRAGYSVQKPCVFVSLGEPIAAVEGIPAGDKIYSRIPCRIID